MDRYLSMESWGPTLYKLYDDLTPANWWTENGGYMGSNDCNALLGTDGQAFAPDIKKEDRLWIFTTDLCRSMFLEFKVLIQSKKS